jgi:hypothetical protein
MSGKRFLRDENGLLVGAVDAPGRRPMVEKIATRNEHGQVVSVLERELTPTEEAAFFAYVKLELFRSQPPPDAAQHLDIVMDPDWIHASAVDRELLRALVLRRVAADKELWLRSGWTQLTLEVRESRPQPLPTPSAAKGRPSRRLHLLNPAEERREK